MRYLHCNAFLNAYVVFSEQGKLFENATQCGKRMWQLGFTQRDLIGGWYPFLV